MPRISAPTIDEHVARQEAAVVSAATRLFAERGFAGVTMSDIASEVGLARTSLYRYFPDKDHILVVWLRREIDSLVERSTKIARSRRASAARLQRWLSLQLDYLQDPEHQLFARIASTVGTLSPEVAAAIGEQHQRLYQTVEPIIEDALAESGQRSRDPVMVSRLVIGLLAAASQEISRGASLRAVRRELEQGAIAIVTGPVAPADRPPRG